MALSVRKSRSFFIQTYIFSYYCQDDNVGDQSRLFFTDLLFEFAVKIIS